MCKGKKNCQFYDISLLAWHAPPLQLEGALLKRFAPFSYVNHSFTLSLNDKVCVGFIVFLQISLCFFICQELCRMRGLWISFTSSCFLFSVAWGSKKFGDWGCQYPITCHCQIRLRTHFDTVHS